MNIEEAKDMLINFRNYNKFFEDLTFLITLEAKESIDKAIETLLTAYEKEKEKNKKLEKFIKNGEYTWKQKYNETFKYFKEELEKEKEQNSKLLEALDTVNHEKSVFIESYEKEKKKNKSLLQCLKDSQERCENEHLFLGNPDM